MNRHPNCALSAYQWLQLHLSGRHRLVSIRFPTTIFSMSEHIVLPGIPVVTDRELYPEGVAMEHTAFIGGVVD